MLDTTHPHDELLGGAPAPDTGTPRQAARPRPVPRRDPGGGGTRRHRPRRPGPDDGGSFDLRNSWQVLVGSILIPLGVIIILIAWYGSAHARVVQQQFPYLVSGSFIGLGCMITGGICYWGHWLYRLYDQAELRHEEQQKVLEEIARHLASGPGFGGTAAVASGQGVAGGASSGAVRSDVGSDTGPAGTAGVDYLATASGSVYHRPGCPVIAHHPDDLRRLGAAQLGGLGSCQICTPD
jgi:hypothetical protein